MENLETTIVPSHTTGFPENLTFRVFFVFHDTARVAPETPLSAVLI